MQRVSRWWRAERLELHRQRAPSSAGGVHSCDRGLLPLSGTQTLDPGVTFK